MINPKILVTGATGKTGGAVVRELLAKGVPVRAMVRTLDRRSAALEARAPTSLWRTFSIPVS